MNDATKKEFDFEAEMDKYMRYYYDICGYTYDWDNSRNNFKGDRKKDTVLYYKGEKKLVEHKYRRKDYGDILVEIVQDLKTNESGWLYECGADVLHYVICNEVEGNMMPIYFYDIRFELFKNWIFGWLTQNKGNYVTSTGGWGITLNLSFPVNIIPNNLIKKYEI